MNAIEAQGLTRQFGEVTAVDGINLSVQEGEIFGLLGPNGAGKTTTIKMLATLLRPTSGKALVCGHDVSRSPAEVRKSIGIVFQDQALDDRLTGEENLDFHARMYGMPARQRKERVAHVLGLVDLADKARVLVKTYSGGMRRRLEIARGLMHAPRVLFLDEPTLGLDPQTRRHIWDYIRKLRSEGTTILLTTHYMDEADTLCSRIAIIDKGKILVTDTPAALKSRVGKDLITIGTSQASALAGHLKGMNPIVHDSSVDISAPSGEKQIPQILRLADRHRIPVRSISLRKPTLEDVFLHFTGRTIREEEADVKEVFRRESKMWGRR